jgi:hypothetical protein
MFIPVSDFSTEVSMMCCFSHDKALFYFLVLLPVYYLSSRGNVVVYSTSRKVAGSRSDEMKEFFSLCLILPAALSPGVYSASNRNKYQKQKNNVSGK